MLNSAGLVQAVLVCSSINGQCSSSSIGLFLFATASVVIVLRNAAKTFQRQFWMRFKERFHLSFLLSISLIRQIQERFALVLFGELTHCLTNRFRIRPGICIFAH